MFIYYQQPLADGLQVFIEILENSHENTSDGVSFSLYMQTNKFLKVYKKILPKSLVNKVGGKQIYPNTQEITCSEFSFLITLHVETT